MLTGFHFPPKPTQNLALTGARTGKAQTESPTIWSCFSGNSKNPEGYRSSPRLPKHISFLPNSFSTILWRTQLKSLKLLQGQLVLLRNQSCAELHWECSPAASWAILQWDTQLKPQGDHHHLNPCQRKDQLWIFGSFSKAWAASSVLAKLCQDTCPPAGRSFWLHVQVPVLRAKLCPLPSQILVSRDPEMEVTELVILGSEGDRVRRPGLCPW